MLQRLASSPSGFGRHGRPMAVHQGAAGPATRQALRAPARADTAGDDSDPLAQWAQADAADASLMRLVLCAASVTLALALASSLI
ncbi:MAG: hypothetical protein IPM15_19725 [Betaproteobacteria bacterium]|nr:hypothetical protein [Betaproteobacteria bacterium]MCC6248436.1 hypothetical protein [Rubrivivax sp.]